MADIAKIVEEIKELSLLEVNDLVKALETEFGVSAAAMAVAAAPAAGAAATATALGSTPNSSFIASTNSLISKRLISFKLSIKLSFVNLAILYSSLNF